MPTLEELQQEITTLKERNRRVEADKAWETSFARKAAILILTYGVVLVFFLIAQLPLPYINALVPTLAFALSTATLPFLKRLWLSRRR